MTLPERASRVHARLVLLSAGIAAGLACAPPKVENDAPRLDVRAPADGAIVPLGDAVPVEVEVADRDGDAPLTVTVRSSIDGELLTLRTEAASGTLTGELTDLSPGGHDLTIVVDDGREGGQRTLVLGLLVNAPPSAPSVTITPASPSHAVDIEARVTTQAVDPDGGAVGYAWTWRLDGVDVVSGGSEIALLSKDATEPGQTWTVRFEAYEATSGARTPGGLSAFVEQSVTIVNTAPARPDVVGLRPSVPHHAQSIHCIAPVPEDPDGDTVELRYTWEVEGVVVAGATTDTLQARHFAGGDEVSCTVVATDGVADADGISSSVTARDAVVDLDDADLRLDAAPGAGVAPLFSPVFLDAVDGPDALVVTVPGGGTSWWYDTVTWRTATSGLFPTPDLTLSTAGLASVRAIPDHDGDRIDDLLVVAPASQTAWVVRSAGVALGGSEPSLAVVGAGMTATSPRNAGLWGVPAVAANVELTGRRSDVVLRVDRDGAEDLVVSYQDGDLTFGSSLGNGNAALSGCVTADQIDDTFGADLDASGDVNGDGAADVVVARTFPTARMIDTDVGAYVFQGTRFAVSSTDCAEVATGSAWMRLVVAPGTGGSSHAGFLPDLDGDAKSDPWANAATAAGRVAIFSSDVGAAGFVLRDASLGQALVLLEGDAQGDGYGAAVEVLGDLDGDGRPELGVLAIPATGERTLHVYEGATLALAASTSAPGARPVLGPADADWTVTGIGPALPGPAFDLDGDGARDLVLATEEGSFLSWFTTR